MKSANEDEWEELLDGKAKFSLWQEQTWLLTLLDNSTYQGAERQEVVNKILDTNLDHQSAKEIAEKLMLSQLHFSNIPNPSQTDIARHIRNLSNNI